MSTITTYLSNLRLSLTQWGLLTASVIIGGLVAALRLQGSRLHSAQVSLLTDHLNNTQAQYDQKVQTAKDRFNAALGAYNKTK
jgi:DUF1680 family protein